MSNANKELYEFGGFRLDVAEHLLLDRAGKKISLPEKVFAMLCLLVQKSGSLVRKDELLETVWDGAFVEENNLDKTVSQLRRALGDKRGESAFIETVRKHGFRFVADVRRVEAEERNAATYDGNSSADEPPAESKISGNHHFTVERTGNVLAVAEWQSEAKKNFVAGQNTGYESFSAATGETLFGRRREIAAIENLLRRDDVRLVTLTGAGGAGKTRLAETISGRMRAEFSDGVFFVELAAIQDAELVFQAIAQTLEIKESGGKSLFKITRNFLHGKRILIVLDNFEQVVSAAPQLAEMLASAPTAKLLVTSRVTLRLSGERQYPVPPLASPPKNFAESLEKLVEYAAVALFVERARTAKPSFALTDENAGSVAEICHRLDGLPLAIELAAARVKILSPRAILLKLENRLKLLTGGARDLPARQQTMRGAIAWSYDLLDADEKLLFRRFSVFAGGATVESVETIGANYESNPNRKSKAATEILDVISSLIDKNLLVSKERAGDEIRLSMLETIREFALDALEQSAEGDEIRCLHADFFLALAEKAEPQMQAAQSAVWLNRLEEEHDNFRAALSWSLVRDAQKAARLATAITSFWVVHSHLTEGRNWLKTVLEKTDAAPVATRLKLLNGLALLTRQQGDFEAARKIYEDGLAAGRATNDLRQIALSSKGLGMVAHRQGENAAARKFFEEGLAICRELNDQAGTMHSLNNLGDLERTEGNYAAARTLFQEAVALSKQLGNKQAGCAGLNNLGFAAFGEGDFPAARSSFAEALAVARELKHKIQISYSLDGFAALAVEGGEAETAARISGAAELLRETIGCEIEPAERLFRDEYLARVRAVLPDQTFIAADNKGRALSTDEAIALASRQANAAGENQKSKALASSEKRRKFSSLNSG